MNLGNALRERHVHTGSLDDLAAGVDAAREAVAEVPPQHTDRPALLSNLAALLRTRASRTGSVADLDAAVTAAGAAAAAAPGGPDRPAMLGNYAIALLTRFERAGDPADLDAAIDGADAAVAAVPAGHPEHGARLSDLGSALLMRYVNRGGQADLDGAVGAPATPSRQHGPITPTLAATCQTWPTRCGCARPLPMTRPTGPTSTAQSNAHARPSSRLPATTPTCQAGGTTSA